MIKIITTHDGSHSLLNEELQETYHSTHGAMQESVYVFIKQGLELVKSSSTIRVLEIGFGTGLNAFLTAQWANLQMKPIQYFTIERYPVPETIWKELNYAQPGEEKVLFEQLHQASWQQWNPITNHFSIYKCEGSLQETDLMKQRSDIVFFDAFAPNKQPAMWELPVLEKVVATLEPGGVFVTYCAKGRVKRDLKSLGLEVLSIPGPPGKREMIRCIVP